MSLLTEKSGWTPSLRCWLLPGRLPGGSGVFQQRPAGTRSAAQIIHSFSYGTESCCSCEYLCGLNSHQLTESRSAEEREVTENSWNMKHEADWVILQRSEQTEDWFINLLTWTNLHELSEETFRPVWTPRLHDYCVDAVGVITEILETLLLCNWSWTADEPVQRSVLQKWNSLWASVLLTLYESAVKDQSLFSSY